MAEITNLNRFRKSKQKQEKPKKAEENRIKHGRTKLERQQSADENAKAKNELEAKKLDNKLPSPGPGSN